MYYIYISAAEFGANDGACVRYTQPTTCYMCGCMPSTERESQLTSQKHDPIALCLVPPYTRTSPAGSRSRARMHSTHSLHSPLPRVHIPHTKIIHTIARAI